MPTLSPAGIERFCRALEQACGLAYTPEKAYLFESRLAEFVAARGLRDYDDLVRLFQESAEARRTITEALVTSETYFFRDDGAFRTLPAILAARRPTAAEPAVVWSLGCATGQEVWSILFALATDGRVPLEAVRLIGVDISARALARAREAQYSDFELQRGIDASTRARFFEPAPGGARVARPWRDVPSWVQANLLEDLHGLPRPDLVFCRNVLIYFEDAVKRRVVARIAERLAPGGMLVLGNAENKLLFMDLLDPVPDEPAMLQARR